MIQGVLADYKLDELISDMAAKKGYSNLGAVLKECGAWSQGDLSC